MALAVIHNDVAALARSLDDMDSEFGQRGAEPRVPNWHRTLEASCSPVRTATKAQLSERESFGSLDARFEP